jgi:GMP synthase (glutamine-hydrolysing)
LEGGEGASLWGASSASWFPHRRDPFSALVLPLVPLCILVAGNTVPALAERRGEFATWIRDGVGDAWAGDWIEVDIRTDAPLPAVGDVDGFFITGSSSSVTERAPWMLRAEGYIREIDAAGTPLLGICFGHQLIAQALGGDVQKNPRGREIGTVQVNVTESDPLFGGEPREIDANASHVDSVAKVPERARVLASTSLDPVAAFAVGDAIRAVQFHPEFDGDVMRGYLTARAHLVRGEGLDADAILANAKDAPQALALLRAFVTRFVDGVGKTASLPRRGEAPDVPSPIRK